MAPQAPAPQRRSSLLSQRGAATDAAANSAQRLRPTALCSHKLDCDCACALNDHLFARSDLVRNYLFASPFTTGMFFEVHSW
jgi:hypothetical protein